MPNWKKVVVSGSDAALNSLLVTGGITGSLLGTASTASYVDLVAGPNITINQVGTSFEISGSGGGGGDTFPYTGSAIISGSLNIIGSFTASGLNYPDTDGVDRQVIKTDGLGNLTFGYPEEIIAVVKNVSGGTLLKGTPVHATESGAMGNVVGIIAASASDASTMPATFVLNETLADEAEGEALASGFIQGVNTSGFEVGQVVYVGESGGYTSVKPTGSNLIQNLGIVTKVDATNGSGFVLGAGRSNDVPNILEGYTWIGNSDGVAIPTPTSSIQNVISSSFASTASYVNPLVQNVIITGSVDIRNGNINLETNAFFLQGTSVGGGTVSLIGVNSSDQTYIGNQGLTNILADSTIISGSLTVTGSNTNLNSSITTKTTRVTGSAYTILNTDYRIGVRYSLTGSCTLQLPNANNGELDIRIKDEEGNADTNNIIVSASAGDLIDGSPAVMLDRNYIAIGLYNDGISNWYIE